MTTEEMYEEDVNEPNNAIQVTTGQLLRSTHADWIETRILTNPLPVIDDTDTIEVNWWSSYGKWFIIIIASLGLFIAARTGVGIYRANEAENFGKFWSFILTVLCVTGVEGLIVAYGFFRLRKIEQSWFASVVEKSYGFVSVIIGILISATSGMKFFINTFTSLQEKWGTPVDQSLYLLLSVGLTFVLFGISEFAGRLKWMHDNMPSIKKHEFEKKLEIYNLAMAAAWEASPEYLRIMRDNLVEKEKIEWEIANVNYGRRKVLTAKRQAEIEAASTAPVQSVQPIIYQQAPIIQQQAPPAKQPRPNVASLVDQYVKAHNLKYEDDLSSATIATALKLNDGSVRSAISRKRETMGIVVSINGQD